MLRCDEGAKESPLGVDEIRGLLFWLTFLNVGGCECDCWEMSLI